MRFKLSLLFLLIPAFCFAQIVLVPDEQDGLWGYVDIVSEDLLVDYQYDVALEVGELGYAMIKKGDYWGMLDNNGHQVLDVKYDTLFWKGGPRTRHPSFLNIKLNDKYGILNHKLETLLPNEYDEIVSFFYYPVDEKSDITRRQYGYNYFYYFKVRKNDKWGLVDSNNKMKVAIRYDEVKPIPHTFHKGLKTDTADNQIIFLKYGQDYSHRPPPATTPDFFLVTMDTLQKIINTQGKVLLQGKNIYNIYLHSSNINGFEKPLIIVNKNKLHGAIDTNGKELIPFQYAEVRYHYDNFFMINQINEDYPRFTKGIVDSNGKIVLPPVYGDISGQILTKDLKRGIATRNFNGLIVPIEYDFLSAQSNHATIIHAKKDSKHGLLDGAGKVIIPFEYQELKGDLSTPLVKRNNRWGIINQKNEPIIPIEYEDIQFTKHRSKLLVKQKGLYGLIDVKTKEWIIPLLYDTIISDYSQHLTVRLKDKWGKIDFKNQIIIPIKFDEIKEKYKVRLGDKWGLYSQYQGLQIDPLYDEIQGKKVRLGDKWGLYGTNNQILLDPIYDEIQSQFIVKIRDYWGLLDENKNWLLPAMFDRITTIYDCAIFYKGDKVGTIDINNTQKEIPARYENLKPYENVNLILAKRNGLWGAINWQEEEIIPIKYKDIQTLDGGILKVYNGINWALYDMAGKQIEPFVFTEIGRRSHSLIKKNAKPTPVYQTSQNKRKGLITSEGEWILPCRYQQIFNQEGGVEIAEHGQLFPVQLQNKWGYVSKGGNVVIPFIYNHAKPFDNGVAVVYILDGFSLIDTISNTLTTRKYKSIRRSYGGGELLNVSDSNDKHGAINKLGEETIPLKFKKSLEKINGGLYVFLENNKYGLINPNGKIIIPAKFDMPPTRYVTGVVYISDKPVFPDYPKSGFDTYRRLESFYKHYKKIKKGLLKGIIDVRTDEVIIPIEYSDLSPTSYSNPLSYIRVYKNKKYGIIDSTNRIIFPIEYKYINVHKELNLVSVTKDKTTHLVNLKGESVSDSIFTQIRFQKQSPHLALKNNKWGCIDNSGKTIIPFIHKSPSRFQNIFYTNNQYYNCPMLASLRSELRIDTIIATPLIHDKDTIYYSITGQALDIKIADSNISFINKELSIAKNPSTKLEGIVDTNGQVILPFEYDYIDYYGGHFVSLSTDNMDGYFLLKNRKVLLFDEVEDEGDDGETTQWVEQNGKSGLIDIYGNFITPLHFNTRGSRSEGLISFSKDGKVGFYNNDGELTIPFNFDRDYSEYNIYYFENGISKAYKNGKYGFINTKGETILPFEYDALTPYSYEELLGYKNGKWEKIIFN